MLLANILPTANWRIFEDAGQVNNHTFHFKQWSLWTVDGSSFPQKKVTTEILTQDSHFHNTGTGKFVCSKQDMNKHATKCLLFVSSVR